MRWSLWKFRENFLFPFFWSLANVFLSRCHLSAKQSGKVFWCGNFSKINFWDKICLRASHWALIEFLKRVNVELYVSEFHSVLKTFLRTNYSLSIEKLFFFSSEIISLFKWPSGEIFVLRIASALNMIAIESFTLTRLFFSIQYWKENFFHFTTFELIDDIGEKLVAVRLLGRKNLFCDRIFLHACLVNKSWEEIFFLL